MPTGEIYVQLSVHFPDNRKVRALARFRREARAARDLYTQMLLHCKENKTDGFVSDEQIGLLVHPDPEAIGKRDAKHLIEVGLIEKAPGGYVVTGWLKRNSSREVIDRKSEAKARGARLANHRRWHVAHDNPDPACEWCQKEARNFDQTTDQTTDRSSDQSSDRPSETERVGGAKRSDSTETETESETESETENVKPLGRQRPAGKRIEPGSDDDPDFCVFWDVYPRRAAKGQARKAWKTAVVKKRADPKEIIRGAERYRDDHHRQSRDIEYTAHPGTWLNGERWLEQHEPQTANGTGQFNYPASPWAQ